MPYIAKLEKAGIPTVMIDFEDQTNMIRRTGLENGVPNVRTVHASRTVPGPADVDRFVEAVLDGLRRPLTEKEKERGKYAPPQERVLFEGTLEEAQAFYQQTKHIPAPVNAPIAVYTDGFPIIVPTEERVREMLRGTSHKPDELVTYQVDGFGYYGDEHKKGDPVHFQPSEYTATVEKVAINAVMAGCKPEYLPAVLAVAESGCRTGTTVFNAQFVCLSGPIVRELEMNTGCGMLGPGNPANATIGRAYQLMAINLGGAVPGVNRMSSIGNPLNNGGLCFAENGEGLPPGWKGLNEEYGFKRDESVVMVMSVEGGVRARQFSPGGYRAFQKSGHGGIARRLDVKGKPGPHNWMQFLVPGLWKDREGGLTFIMVPEMARHLYECGFKSKDEVYDWLWKQSFEPVGEFRKRSWPDLNTNGWMGIEATSGKHWKELSDDEMVPAGGNEPFNNCIVVSSSEEEVCVEIEGSRAAGSGYSIDAWR